MKKLNNKINISLSAAGLVMLALSNNALGEAGLSAAIGPVAAPVTANVNFEVNVAKIMLLRVGDWGDTANKISWNNGFNSGLTDPKINTAATKDDWDKTATANQITATDDETETDKAGDGALKVAAYSNIGSDLTLRAVAVEFLPVGGGALPVGGPTLSNITVTNTDGSISHPDFNDANGITLSPTAGVINLEDTWSYTYTPAANTAGGEYTASVVYTLATI